MTPKEQLQNLSNRWTDVVADIRELGSELENRFSLLLSYRKDLSEEGLTLKADFSPTLMAALDAYRKETREGTREVAQEIPDEAPV